MFGFALPTVPDWLEDHTLCGESPAERMSEFWRRWTQFVASLWTPTEVTYALRFDWLPQTGEIQIGLLGRCMSRLNEDSTAHRLGVTLHSFGFGPRPLEKSALVVLNNRLEVCSRSRLGVCFEVRQGEEEIPIRHEEPTQGRFRVPEPFILKNRRSDRVLYSVSPWWGPGDSFLLPFTLLAGQPEAVSVCVLLQPTRLTEAESKLLADVARQAESLSQLQSPADQLGGAVLRPSQNQTDPQLRFAARVYAANLRRLTRPFLASVYCFSERAGCGLETSVAFANGVREERPADPPAGENEHLPAGADAVRVNDDDVPLALSMCTEVHTKFLPLMKTTILACGDLRRLRYLVDARGAASVFRVPVGVRGGVPGIEVRQQPPGFHPGPCAVWARHSPNDNVPKSERRIALGRLSTGGVLAVPLNDLTMHGLVTGFTGTGKTNTICFLLDQLWKDHKIPFLVLEYAKTEYRNLLNVPHFDRLLPGSQPGSSVPETRVYTLGHERCAPFRLNPFELFPGVRLEAHIGRLQACFEAAMPQEGPLPSLIADALIIVYEARGWRLTDIGGEHGTEVLAFPTLKDFETALLSLLLKADPVTNPRGRGYQGEVLANLRGFVTSRISPLLVGSKGRMFGTQRSIPAKELFGHPTVLELNDLNLNDKALVMLFVLTMLREYREIAPANDGLGHVTVIEEAHNVLANVGPAPSSEGSGQADTRHSAVEAICNMLTEVRSYGEGLIVVDQSPEKLAPDAMRNTNLQLAHQLRDSRDREAVARAMLMTDEQEQFVGKVPKGWAAGFFTGLEKATFLKVPQYYKVDSDEPLSGRGVDVVGKEPPDIKRHMLPLTAEYMSGPFGAACQPCPNRIECPYRRPLLNSLPAGWLAETRPKFATLPFRADPRSVLEVIQPILGAALAGAEMAGHSANPDAIWCALLHMWGRPEAVSEDLFPVIHRRVMSRLERLLHLPAVHPS